MQEDYVLNVYLCRNIKFIIGACVGIRNKGLADLTTYESIKGLQLQEIICPCYNF